MTTQPTGQSLSKRVRRQARAAGQSNDPSMPGVSPAIVEDLSATPQGVLESPVIRPVLYKSRSSSWEESALVTFERCHGDLGNILRDKHPADPLCLAANAAMSEANALLKERKFQAAAVAAWNARYDAWLSVLMELREVLQDTVSPFRANAESSPELFRLVETVNQALTESADEATRVKMAAIYLLREAISIVELFRRSDHGRKMMGQEVPLTRVIASSSTNKSARPRRSNAWLKRQEDQRRFAASCPSGPQGPQFRHEKTKKG